MRRWNVSDQLRGQHRHLRAQSERGDSRNSSRRHHGGVDIVIVLIRELSLCLGAGGAGGGGRRQPREYRRS